MQQKIIKLFAITLFLIGFAGCKSNSLKDIEGNKYKTVSIGTQIWMSENLKTTKFNDGTEIPIVTDNEDWAKLQTPAVSWYNNDPVENKKTYGALYNWYSVNTNKLCPTRWHVPNEGDWASLITFWRVPVLLEESSKKRGLHIGKALIPMLPMKLVLQGFRVVIAALKALSTIWVSPVTGGVQQHIMNRVSSSGTFATKVAMFIDT